MTAEAGIPENEAVQAVFHTAVQTGQIDPVEAFIAVRLLEQQKQTASLADLAGNWRLVWTSGTQQYQDLQSRWQSAKPKSTAQSVTQQIETQPQQLQNRVTFPGGSLTISGPFDYQSQRIQFTFNRVQLRLGAFPPIALPLGNWAKGWLQTTYLDETLHIERGDRGGISVYVRAESTP